MKTMFVYTLCFLYISDVQKLARDFAGFDVNILLSNCIDSGVMANGILPVTQRWSMEKLVDYVVI